METGAPVAAVETKTLAPTTKVATAVDPKREVEVIPGEVKDLTGVRNLTVSHYI